MTRTIVLVVAILSGALLVTNLLSLLTLAGGMSLSQIQKMNTQSFEESEEFSKMVESYMYDVQEKLYLQNLFESDGAYKFVRCHVHHGRTGELGRDLQWNR